MSTKLPKGLRVERFGGEIFTNDWKVTHEASGLMSWALTNEQLSETVRDYVYEGGEEDE